MAKTVFITGSSSGIGQAIVHKFLSEGWNVVASLRDPKKSGFIEHEQLLIVQLDVTNDEQILQAYQIALQRFGTVDVLINNAGYGLLGPLESFTKEQYEEQFNVNVFGLIAITNQFMPHFRKNNSGVVINMSSMYGKISMPYLGVYAATKHAVEALSESLQQEVSSQGIRVAIIEPGAIKTNFFVNAQRNKLAANSPYNPRHDTFIDSIFKHGNDGDSPTLVANAAFKAASANKLAKRYVTDKTARLLVNLHRFLPFKYYAAAIKKYIG